jgi:uncharacterized coiled-coil protein SlyX
MSTTNESQYTSENFWKSIAALETQISELGKKIAEQSVNIDKMSAETGKKIAEQSINIDKIAAESAETGKIVATVSRNVGYLTNSLGKATEYILLKGLEKKFLEYGLEYKIFERNYFMTLDDGKVIGEIDMLLKGDDCLMNAEAKWHPSTRDISQLVTKQMPKIRAYFNSIGDSRKLYCAIAGFQIDENVLNFATQSGVFVIQSSEDAVSVFRTPSDFQPRGW